MTRLSVLTPHQKRVLRKAKGKKHFRACEIDERRTLDHLYTLKRKGYLNNYRNLDERWGQWPVVYWELTERGIDYLKNEEYDDES